MRSFWLLSVATVCASVSAAWAEPALIAFERSSAIWVANTDGKNPRKIADGSAPSFSPDGARIVFQTNGPGGKELKRQIAIVDVASKQVTVFEKQIPSENCQRPVWSRDGSLIAFEIFTEGDWHLALINPDGTGFRYLKKSAPKGNSLWSICWAADSKSLFVQDLANIRRLALDGSQVRHWKVASLIPQGSFSSASSFAVSPDGKTLLVDVEMQDEHANMPDWDGPPPAVWTLDLANRSAERLTPKGRLASGACWLDASNVLFVSQTAQEKTPSIYRLSTAGGTPQRVLKDASAPAVSGAK